MPNIRLYITRNQVQSKPVFHLATLFARREAKTRIRYRDWLKLAGEKIRREIVRTVPTFLSVRANKVAKQKTGFKMRDASLTMAAEGMNGRVVELASCILSSLLYAKHLPKRNASLLNGVLGIRSFDTKGSSTIVEKV